MNRFTRPLTPILLAVLCALGASSCGGDTEKKTTTIPTSTAASLATGIKQVAWQSNVDASIQGDSLEFQSDGIPSHERDAMYAVPTGRAMAPTADAAVATADPTAKQAYAFSIPLTPTVAKTSTSTSLGVIGVMISGATLFNPYEGDNTTVATKSNFSVQADDGTKVWFLDDCAGHPTPMGQYHYHGLPKCVTSMVDEDGGASHIIGVALDGYPIYGDRDIDGKQVTAAQLDSCNGITSATPEFPDGAYHYVLLDVADSTSSIRCFHGEVDAALTQNGGMPGMDHGRPAGGPPAGGPPAGGPPAA